MITKPMMIGFRSLVSNSIRARPMLISRLRIPALIQQRGGHGGHGHDGPPQPFDNMPFSIPNRYVATLFFAVFFGVGFWAPFLLLWYMMAKRTL